MTNYNGKFTRKTMEEEGKVINWDETHGTTNIPGDPNYDEECVIGTTNIHGDADYGFERVAGTSGTPVVACKLCGQMIPEEDLQAHIEQHMNEEKA
jgi:hypothetical protein